MFFLFNRLNSDRISKLKLSKPAIAALLMIMTAASGIFAADLTWNTNIDDYAIRNNVNTVDIDANITITTLNIYNRPNNSDANTCVIDLKGHTLNITNLKIGAYSLLGTKTSGSVQFIDSVGSGTVEVTKLDATAYYYEKHLEVSAPVVLTISNTLDTNAGNKDYSFLEFTGDGEIVVNATPTDTDNVSAKDVTVSGTYGSAITRTVSGTAFWNGSQSDNWFTPSNWTGISDITDLETISRIEIPGGFTRYPVATSDVTTAPSCALVIGEGGSCTFKGSASLNNITLAPNATLESHGNLSISSMTAPNNSILKFNQGTGAQTTTIGEMNFYGASIDFGNDADDVFNMGATGDGTLDLRDIPTVKLAGTINSSNLTLNDSPSLAANTTLPKVTLAYDTVISGAGYSLKLIDSLDSAIAATPRSLTVNANKVLLEYLDPVSDGPQIGATNNLKDITFNCDYEGKNGSNITCTGNFTVNGGAQFRGDITAYSIKVTKTMTFGGMCHSVKTVKDQDYTSGATSDPWGVTLWRNDAANPLQLYSTDGGTITFHGNINSYNYDSTARQIKFGSMGSIYAGKPAKVIINGKVGNVYKLDFIEINADIEFHNTVNANSLSLTSDITTATIYNNITTYSTYKTESYSQHYEGNVTLKGNANLIAGANPITFSGTVDSDGTPRSLTIGNETNASTVTFAKDVGGTNSLNNLTFYSDLTLNDTVTKVNVSSWNNEGAGSVNPGSASTVTVTKDISGSANTFNNLTIAGTGTSLISGNNKVNGDFTCTQAGKTLSFEAGKTLTVDGSFTITGEAGEAASKITLNSQTAGSQWILTTPAGDANVTHAIVTDSKSTNPFIRPSYSTNNGNNTNWIFAANYRWLSNTTGTDWETAANWQVESSAGVWTTATDFPGNGSDEDTVKVVANANSKYPVYSSASKGIILDSLEVDADAAASINTTYNIQLIKTSSPLTNKGTVIFQNTGRFIDTTLPTAKYLVDTTQGTVEFEAGSSTVENINPADDTAADYNNVIISGAVKLAGNIKTKGSFTVYQALDGNSKALNIGTKLKATATATITDVTTLTVNGDASIGADITTSGSQKYQGKVTLTQDVTLKAKNNITFEDNATITGASYNLTLDNDSSHQADYDLKKDVTVKSLTANIATGKKLSIPSPVVITAKEGFTVNGAGTVNLGTESQTADTKIITEKKDINFSGTGTVTVNSPVILDTTSGAASASGNITIKNPFQGKIADPQPLTIKAGTGNVNLQSDIGTSVSLGDVTITDKDTTLSQAKELKAKTVSITGAKIKTEQSSKITTAQTVALTNSDLFLTEKGSVITALTGFTKNGTGLSQIAGTVRTNNSAITFNNTTYIYNASTFDTSNNGAVASPTADITIGSGTTDDLYISALEGTSPQAVSFTASTLDVKGNVVLFNGNVTLKADIKSGMDIVLLNGNTDNMYDLGGVDDLIAYINPLRSTSALKEPSLTAFPALLPEGTSIDHSIYRSSLTGFDSKTITAGKNFYDNGVNLEPAGDWTLSLKSNDDATVSFAEAYNARIKNCSTVTCHDGDFAWLAAGEGCTDAGNNSTDTLDSIDYGTDDGTGKFNCTKTGIAFLHPVILVDDNSKTTSEGRTTGPEIPLLSGTYAVRDNVLRVEFVRNNCTNGVVPAGTPQKLATSLIENSNNEIWNAVTQFKFNDGTSAFTGAYIDAECTVTTTGQGDLAVIYIKASSRWNLDATGTSFGTKADTTGSFHNDVYNDIYFQKIVAGIFATLYDNHKNRLADYSQVPYERPASDHREGFRFTAVTNRCSIDDMHITFTIADFESNKVYVYFDHALANDRINWNHSDISNPITTESTIKIYSDINNRTAINVESVDINSLNDHGIILTLDQDLGYDMINYGIKVEYASGNLLSTKIQSKNNRIVNNGESHCISDVITTNCVDVQYAYDNRYDAFIDSTGGLAPFDSIVMRNFTGEGSNNKVFADKNITLVTKNVAPADAKGNEANFKYKLIADITPTPNCNGTTYEVYSGNKTRFWFPEGNATVSGFAPVLNDSPNRQTSSAAVSNIEESSDPLDPDVTTYLFHNFSEETPCLNWHSGSDVRFLFEVLKNGTRVMINHKFDGSSYENGSEMTPLYLARLKNPADLTSIDLWSFIISEPQRQRGGVSIYSNVVNATSKEFCTLEVNMPRDGNLRVIVNTADGNVVKYLESGRQTAGLHYYYWNGTNNSGKEVARGIYFIRVVGPDIEETRKVMVVK